MEIVTSPILTMNENYDFGEAVAALAVLSGATEIQAAIQATNFLAALAGPQGGLVGLGGEVHPIGSSMISVGSDSPEQTRLTELLFSPLRYLQRDLMDCSSRVEPELLERLATSLSDPHPMDTGTEYGLRRAVSEEERAGAELRHTIGQALKSTQVVSISYPVDRFESFRRMHSLTSEEWESARSFAEMSSLASIDFEMMLDSNEARCLREPLVLLENPDSSLLLRGMDRVDHQSPLVLDSDGHLLAGLFGKPRHKAAEVIEGLLSGRSTRTVNGGAKPGRGILFSITDRPRLARWIGSREDSRLLRRTLLVDPTDREGNEGSSCDVETIRRGYAQYRKSVKDTLRLRRLDAPGTSPILGDKTAELFFHAQREFQARINEVEALLKPFAAAFAHLAASMLWSLDRLCEDRGFQELIPTAIRLAEAAMRTHHEIVKHGLEAGERQKLEDEGRIMLRKLLRYEPCRFRELYRKYDDQDVSLHRPVFDYLIETERVLEVEKGLFRVTEQGRRQLKAVGVN